MHAFFAMFFEAESNSKNIADTSVVGAEWKGSMICKGSVCLTKYRR